MSASIVETAADHPEHRRIFVDTFSDEPSFRFMLPNDDTRKKHVAWLVQLKLKLFGGAYVSLSTPGVPRGFAWWLPPGKKPQHGVAAQLAGGYWQAPFRLGVRSFDRLLRFGSQESRLLRPYVETPHWILDVIATDPSHQRSGLGGALMQPVFERSERDGTPCFVLTHNARNVGFYEKYGFRRVLEEPVMGPGSPVAFGLVRAPSGARLR
ncbi:MAG: GNAT family N-acetyltransferase [Archangium sp.]|nr:GNAT family N-acetyltransferase [Archangium sp.]